MKRTLPAPRSPLPEKDKTAFTGGGAAGLGQRSERGITAD